MSELDAGQGLDVFADQTADDRGRDLDVAARALRDLHFLDRDLIAELERDRRCRDRDITTAEHEQQDLHELVVEVRRAQPAERGADEQNNEYQTEYRADDGAYP